MAEADPVTEPSPEALEAAHKLIANNNRKLKAAADAKEAAEAKLKAAKAAGDGPGVPVSQFGRRTDGAQGMQLGLAPSGLGAAGRSTDSDAPDGLSDLATGQVVPTTVQPPQPVAKPELPFNRQIREASEAAAKQAAADKQAALKLSASMNEGNLTDAQKSAKIVEGVDTLQAGDVVVDKGLGQLSDGLGYT